MTSVLLVIVQNTDTDVALAMHLLLTRRAANYDFSLTLLAIFFL